MTRVYFNGNWHAYVDYEVSTIRQNIAANTTTAKVSVWLGVDTNYSIAFTNTYGAYIGVTLGGESRTIPFQTLQVNGSRQFVGSVDITVEHNSDGSGQRTVSIWSGSTSNIYYGGFYLGSLDTSSSVTFAKIARKNTIISCPSRVDIWTPFSVTSQNYYSGFYVYWDVKYNDKGQWKWLSPTVGNNVTINTIKEYASTLMNEHPNSKSITLTVDCVTKTAKDGETIGISSQEVTVVFSRCEPTLGGLMLTDTNSKVANVLQESHTFLQALSTIQATFTNVSGRYGATVTSYYAEIAQTTLTIDRNGGQFGALKDSGQYSVTAYVMDNRGFKSNVVTVPITILAYSPPALSFDVIRSGSHSDTIVVRRNAMISPITVNGRQKNRLTLSFQTRSSTASQWITNTGAKVDSVIMDRLIASEATLNGRYSPMNSYDVQGMLSDAFMSVSVVSTVGVEEVVLSYAPSGVGVGKVWERGTLDVKGTLFVEQDIVVNNRSLETLVKQVMLQMYPIGSLYLTTMNTSPANFIGGKWERYGNGRALVGVDESQSHFKTGGSTGGSLDLPLPQIGMPNTGNTNRYLDSDKLGTFNSPRGWDVQAGNEMKPTLTKLTGYDKLQPYITVYIWKRTA